MTPSSKPPVSKPPATKSTPVGPAKLPTSCQTVVGDAAVTAAVGKPLGGKTIYIKNTAEPKIGRTGRATCRYGVNGKTVPVEIGIAGYSTTAAAAARITATVDSDVGSGAKPVKVTVGGQPATVLLGTKTDLLVVQLQNRTVAITLVKGLAKDPQKALTDLGTTALTNLP